MGNEFDGEEPSRRLVRIGGPVDTTKVTLRIEGDDLDPEEVTQLLRFPPTSCRRKGEQWRFHSGKRTITRKARTGRWSLESPPGRGDLDRHVQWFLEILPEEQEVWDTLRTRFEMDLFCGLFLEDSNRDCELSASAMRELGRRGIGLSLDIYCIPDEDEDDFD